MEKQRVLITVKTYPTLSRKYGETVCTAGVREDGTWVRIYPVPFRRLDEKQQYSKYDWVECRLQRNTVDVRPETFRPVDQRELVPLRPRAQHAQAESVDQGDGKQRNRDGKHRPETLASHPVVAQRISTDLQADFVHHLCHRRHQC